MKCTQRQIQKDGKDLLKPFLELWLNFTICSKISIFHFEHIFDCFDLAIEAANLELFSEKDILEKHVFLYK